MSTTISPLSAHRNTSNGIADIRDLTRGQPIESLDAGEALAWQGDKATDIFEICGGALRLCRILPDGRRAILRFVFAGEFLGLAEGEDFPWTAEAINPVTFRRLRRSRFAAAVEQSPALNRAHVALICEELSAAHEQMILLGRKNAEERVASFLVAMMRRAGLDDVSGDVFDLPMTRLDMADYLGLTIETVSRIMSKLSRQGLIAARGRHQICGRNAGALRAIAEVDEEMCARPLMRRAA
ncbi:helix-turn-helix domain-containing protein [Propylenella binzhouense]|uniref:Cyclic nucleotide-binding domain-containing protein n=1 Tax=Propylenella binzhouense TaxID=2555902 RepID=A0A964WTF6_9HYPH|nr:helix-turn-helix domain-containing protein [Propylenella binzhouense]MYZ47977.1 cyclic nucleotide-binding domain-containing protein [Propylenella binzhouense]